MEQVNEMESMKIPKLALKISIPMVLSMISIALYQIIDTVFITLMRNDNVVTAISLCVPLVSIITAIALGTAIGVNSILAKTLGENNEQKSKKIIVNGIILTFISWVVTALICRLGGVNLFIKSFSKNKEIQDFAIKYLSIISVFSIGTFFQILFEKILEAYGKAKSSMWVQFSGAIVNLVLDPILIFGIGIIPALGIKGAAISTVIGQIFGMILGIIFITKQKIIELKALKNLKIEKQITKEIYKVGFPTMILEMASSFITMILNKILIEVSDLAVSVWGLYSQLQKFVIIIVYGLNYGMIPIVAYNFGAKNKERVVETIKFYLKLAVGVTFIGATIFMIMPDRIITIYKVSSVLIEIAVPAFRILGIGFVFAGISLVISSSFQALGNGTYSLIINLSRNIIFVVPLILILKNFMGIYAVWTSFAIAEILTTIVAVILYKKIYKNIIEKI